MENQPFTPCELGAMPLRGAHEYLRTALLPHLTDADKLETAMSKTPYGYVFEIRYTDKAEGRPWAGDSMAIEIPK